MLADFIESFGDDAPPFVSANLDLSGEPRLAALASSGDIVSSTVLSDRGERIGIVGATTPLLPAISSPRNVRVLADVAGIVQRQVDALTRRSVNKIILVSHLQSVEEDRALVPRCATSTSRSPAVATSCSPTTVDLLVPGDVRTTDPTTGQPFRTRSRPPTAPVPPCRS